MTVAEVLEQTLRPKAKPAVDAAEMLAQLRRRAGALRGVANPEASAEELQAGNQAGTLVARKPCKLVREDGPIQTFVSPAATTPSVLAAEETQPTL